MNLYLIYGSIFFFSFIILSLQVILATLLTTLTLSPFLAVSFAFLGLSIAGVYVYIKYPRDDYGLSQQQLLNAVSRLALLLLFCPVAIKYFILNPQINKEALGTDISWNWLLVKGITTSMSLGLIFSLIFFFLGIFYSLIYKYYSDKASKLYFFDLSGAALGCIFPIFILDFLQLSSVFILLSFFSSLFFVLLAWRYQENKSAKIISLICLLSCFLFLCFNVRTDALETTVGIRGFVNRPEWKKDKNVYTEIWHRWNAYSKTSLYKKENTDRQEQNYIFSIVGGIATVNSFNPANPWAFKLFNQFDPAALGFLLNTPKDILILLAGAGNEMVMANSYSRGSSDITGVELNPLIVKKAMDLPGYNLKTFFAQKNVHMVIQEARSYVESTNKKFDSIIISYSGDTAMQYLGIDSHTTQYLYTKEAFKSYLKHLKPNGTIAIVGMNKVKIVAAVKAALEELNYENVFKKVILMDYQSNIQKGYSQAFLFYWNDIRLLIKNSDFTKEEIDKIQFGLNKMGMDWIYNPYYTRKDFEIFENLLKSANVKLFLRDWDKKHDQYLTLPTDDAPLIANTLSVKSIFSPAFLHDILNRNEPNKRDAPPPLALSNLLMISFVIFLALLGLLLIILPLFVKTNNIAAIHNFRILSYFAAIGLGFTFTEITIMHAFTLLLGNPIYAFSLVLLSLLSSAAGGAFLSEYLFNRGHLNIKKLSLLTFIILCLHFLFISKIIVFLLPLTFPLRLTIALILLTPLGACLGMFFPQGLKRIFYNKKTLIPWAWGINGYMSIVGSTLSIYLLRTTGFSSLILLAAFLYLLITVISD